MIARCGRFTHTQFIMPAFSYSSRAVNLSHRRKRNRIAEAFDECDAQRGMGKQKMSLSLSFVAGKVT